MPKKRNVNRSTTDRLKRLIEAELDRQELTDEEAAREARLPGNAFRALRKGHRPSLDRANELAAALGLAFTIGKTPANSDSGLYDEGERS